MSAAAGRAGHQTRGPDADSECGLGAAVPLSCAGAAARGPRAPVGLTSPLEAGPASRTPAVFWRPWVGAAEEDRVPRLPGSEVPGGRGGTQASGKRSRYQHPVRLFWPKSKCYDYLYQEAEVLLKNFPVQATISFYEDSDSEDDTAEMT